MSLKKLQLMEVFMNELEIDEFVSKIMNPIEVKFVEAAEFAPNRIYDYDFGKTEEDGYFSKIGYEALIRGMAKRKNEKLEP